MSPTSPATQDSPASPSPPTHDNQTKHLQPPTPPLSPTTPETASSSRTSTWSTLESTSASIIPVLPSPSSPPPPIHTWPAIKTYISTGNLSLFKRNPFDRVRYKAWCRHTIAQHGSMTAYMLAERLHWTALPDTSSEAGPAFECVSQTPFEYESDYKILFNDWPYGSLDPEVVHLIVWSKPRIQTDRQTGFPTADAQEQIEAFVKKAFSDVWDAYERDEAGGSGGGGGRAACARDISDDVLWFKNPPSLQTVAGLEHIHVLLRDPPPTLVERWTGEKGPTPHPGFD